VLIFNLLTAVFITALRASEIPRELRDEILGRVTKIIVSLPDGTSLDILKRYLK